MYNRTIKEAIINMIDSYKDAIKKNNLDYGDKLYHAYIDFIEELEYILDNLD
ncbi:MAG TPA: hypothetical protein GX708_05505 [Gallicola sp.]|nr:hypothetical protein [Gallicola sp.]